MFFFFFTDTATTEIYTLPLHDALPISVLLPYPHATDDHQRKNAEVFNATGGALVLDEQELGNRLEHQLAATLGKLIANSAKRAAMSQAIRRHAQLDATWDVATMIRHLA